MSVLVSRSDASDGSKRYFLFTKGAPEILSSFLSSLPLHYTHAYLHHMARGKRVLALAYKEIILPSRITKSADISAFLKEFSREEAEKSLSFLGFLVFDCDLKPDTKRYLKTPFFFSLQ